LKGEQKPAERTLFWRLQGQTAIRHGDDKLIRLSHRPAQLFQPGTDLAEARDLADDDADKFRDLFRQLGEWEAGLPTVPLWGSSPYWIGQSAKHYDEWLPRPEPR
jgi:arylsulfatase A-like enzyme